MVTCLYDGSFEGYLTAVFEIYAKKLSPDRIVKAQAYTPYLVEETVKIITDIALVKRVIAGIEAKGSSEVLQKIYKVFLSELPELEILLLKYIRLILVNGAAIEQDYRQPEILRVKEINKQIHREVHRMHAFVRFQKTTDDLYYATIEPDFDVIPLIGEHFEKRYSDQHWMIYDSRRKYGLYYDQQQTVTVEWGSESSEQKPTFAADEKAYEFLWKNYFNSVNIIERKNVKLHLRHMPKRYWKYLTEKK